MKESEQPQGIRVFYSDELSISNFDTSAGSMVASGVRRSGQEGLGIDDVIAADLSQQGLKVSSDFELTPGATASSRRTVEAEPAAAVVDVPVEVGELAMVLVERDGVLEWKLPEPGTDAFGAETGVDVRRSEAARVLRFNLAGLPSAAESGRRNLLGLGLGGITERIRVRVLKFAAGLAVGKLSEHLEKNLRPGPVSMAGELDSWSAGAAPRWPDGVASGRILLFIHGTFSSTAGSFGALAATPWGSAFLADVRSRYAVVLGFDHSTLCETPEANADAIAKTLAKIGAPAGTEIDIIAFSRGGLVTRVLVETILPGHASGLLPRRVVFVGCTNGGTALADRANWKTLLDLYTNLAAAAGRGLTLFGAPIAGRILSESIKTLGGLVQAVVDAAITDALVPGIAAMAPKSPIIAALNAPSDGRDVGDVSYFALGSDFDLRLLSQFQSDHLPISLPHRLGLALANLAVDRLMQEGNDLVVDTEAMRQFGAYGKRLAGSIVWGKNLVLYHTIYFAHPATVRSLRAWLFDEAVAAVPPLLVTNPMHIDADSMVEEAVSQIENLEPETVVVLRRRLGSDANAEPRYYLFTAAELLRGVGPAQGGEHLIDALDLHETQGADVADEPPGEGIGARGWAKLDNDVIVAAIPPLRLVLPPTTSVGSTSDGAKEELARGSISEPDKGGAPPSNSRRSDGGQGAGPVRAPPTPAVTSQAQQEVTCNFAADMPASIELGKMVDLRIDISREIIAIITGPTAATISGRVEADRPLTIDIDAKGGLEVMDDGGNWTMALREQTRVPDVDKPLRFLFNVRGTALGAGEIRIRFRQGARLLTPIVLQPTVLAGGVITARATASTAADNKPVVELRIREISEDANGPFKLLFLMLSRDLDISIDVESGPFQGGRKNFIQAIYKRLEGEWGRNENDFDAFMLGLRSYGTGLYNQLVPLVIREKIWEHKDRIGSIEVISHEPLIPWEVLPVVDPGRIGSPRDGLFLADLGVVRWAPNSGFAPATLSIRKGRCRHVVPDYADPRRQLKGAQKERAMVAALLGSTEVDAKKMAVVDLINTPDAFDVLHFACHGKADPDLISNAAVELAGRLDASGIVIRDSLDAADVSAYANLRGVEGNRPVVFLNACQAGQAGGTLVGVGGMAEAFLQAKAGLFVGALWSVGDGSALAFAQTFYQSLLDGQTLVEATRTARQEIKGGYREPTWLAYTIYGHPYARVVTK